ncbi:MAG: TolC family protein [Candidatus Hydrogenedentes bacterium]|nr:TolC family protein [Candidatus Hydrogenedentota bacterium]
MDTWCRHVFAFACLAQAAFFAVAAEEAPPPAVPAGVEPVEGIAPDLPAPPETLVSPAGPVRAEDLPELEQMLLEPKEGAVVLELVEAQRQALEENPNLQAAAARVEQARARVRQARALYFPQVSASYSVTHTELPESSVEAARNAALQGIPQRALSSLFIGAGSGGAGGASAFQLFNVGSAVVQGIAGRNLIDDDVSSFKAGLVANYLVFDGFSRKFTNAIARFGQQESEAAYREAQRLLLAAVAQTYFGVQLARENFAIALADEAFNRRLLKEAEARRRVGTGSLSDVLNFEVRVRAARATLLLAQNDYQQARIALAALLGDPEVALPDNMVVAPLAIEKAEEMAVPAEPELVAFALEHRPDLLRSEFGLQRGGATVQQRKSAYYPQVVALASKDATHNAQSKFEEDDFSTTVGVNVSYTVYAGGRRKAAVAEARHLREEAEQLRQQAELTVRQEVRQTLADLRTAQEQLVLQRTTAEYVEQNRDLVEKEYDAGQGTLARLNQAQRDLIEAQARLALARVSLRLAWHELHISTASILDDFTTAED